MNVTQQRILVLDFGSQYTQLIARRVRETRVYCEIIDPEAHTAAGIAAMEPSGLILSGGPRSVHDSDAPRADPGILDLGIPVLGICYGLQWMNHVLGGRVQRSGSREYGPAELEVVRDTPLFHGLPQRFRVWMSHADEVVRPAPGLVVIGASESVPCAAVQHETLPLFGVQFHPEVVHTRHGKRIIRNFTRRICGCRGDWTPRAALEQAIDDVREQVGDGRVVCGLSGGVDSTVAAGIIHRAIGDRLTCIFVDNGLLRHNEARDLLQTFERHLQLDVRFVDASDRFLDALQGVTDPERKRKIIGHLFIDVFREVADSLTDVRFLAQGTTYPDLIESSGIGRHADVIKSHHNVGGLPAELGFDLVEPLRMLFKDEVRAIGKQLGLPDDIVWRQPFPGPGLAVRIVGEVTRERLALLRAADQVVLEEIQAAGWYRKLWQSFAVLLPVQTVGVMGDERTYETAVALRCVHSTDGMTADWARLPYSLLERIATRITNEIRGINRVVYDVTSKPPGTIEWE